MFVPMKMAPGEISLIKVRMHLFDDVNEKDEKAKKMINATNNNTESFIGQQTSLSVQGFTPEGEVMFKYEN